MLRLPVSYKLTDVSEVLTAAIIREMEKVSTLKRRSASTRLHGATSQKAIIVILVAVRT
jgi:hypothetical protein